MSALIQLFDRPIAYNPAFAKLRAGKIKAGPVAAVFLSQMVYWHNRMDGAWMYKTQADITSETALTRDEQETARKRLVALGVLQESRRGVPATMHYRINPERLEILLLETVRPTSNPPARPKTRMRDLQNVETPQSGLVQSRNQECGNPANKNVEAPQTRMGEPPEQACGDPTNFHTGDYKESTQEITQEKNPVCQPASQADPEVALTDSAKRILTHLNQSNGSRYQVGKSSLENIRARLAEGFTVEELILTTDYLIAKWADDLAMADYLRPTTMFQPAKFPAYLTGAQRWLAAGRPKRVNGTWVRADGENVGEGVNREERDAAYRRFIGSGRPLRQPSELEERVKAEASKAGVRSMNESFAVTRWNSIWKECAARLSGGRTS